MVEQRGGARRADYRIEPMDSNHLGGVSAAYESAFHGSLLASLSARFLRELFASFTSIPGSFGYVSVVGQDVVGFVVGSENGRRHRNALLKYKWPQLLLGVLRSLMAKPRLVVPLTRYVWAFLAPRVLARLGASAMEEARGMPRASLVLLGVAPSYRRQSIASDLTVHFLEEMSRRRVDSVKLVVAADNNPAVALYRSMGWRVAGQYRTSQNGSALRMIRAISAPGL